MKDKFLSALKRAGEFASVVKGSVKTVHIFLLLVLAALGTSLMASGTLAKYASNFSATGVLEIAAFAGGGVIDFNVDVDSISPGETQVVTFSVKNYEDSKDCEVAMTYDIQVESTGNLPLSFTLSGEKKENGAESALAETVEDCDDTSFTAEGGLFLPVGTDGRTTHGYTLLVHWPSDKAGEMYSSEIDMLTVTVTATQRRPGEAGAVS